VTLVGSSHASIAPVFALHTSSTGEGKTFKDRLPKEISADALATPKVQGACNRNATCRLVAFMRDERAGAMTECVSSALSAFGDSRGGARGISKNLRGIPVSLA
jgi:hypothetical protein